MELDEQIAWLEGFLYEATDRLKELTSGDEWGKWARVQDRIPEVLAS